MATKNSQYTKARLENTEWSDGPKKKIVPKLY